jgi:iron complex outermembrane receptor protein
MHITQLKGSKRLALAIAIAATPLTGEVLAQDGLALEEVIVTAERRETSLQNTPIAVTAFDAQKIADMGIYNITDIGAIAPNTNIQKQPSSNSNMSIFIRGVGSGETSLMVDPKTSFYIDGVYMSKTVGAVFDIVDLERIEVLRGPQGTLFGRNSTGGALNVTTAKPTGELSAKVEAGIGNDGYMRLAGTVNLPKFADMVSVKLSGMIKEYDGWAENDYNGDVRFSQKDNPGASEEDLGSEDNEGYRLAVRFEPMDNLTIDYAYDKTDNTGVPTPFQITEVKSSIYNGFTDTPFPYAYLGGQLYQEMAATVGDPEDRRDKYTLDSVSEEYLEVDGHSLTVEWELDLFTLKYIFADRETESGYGATDLDGGDYSASDLFYGGTAVVPTPGFVAAIDEGSIDLTTHEFQIIGDAFDERLQFTGGVFYYEEEVYQDNPQTFGLPIQFLAGDPSLGPIYTGAGYCDADGTCIGSQRLPLPFPNVGADPNGNGFTDFIYGQDTESWAVYSQLTWSLTDDIDITAGVRYTEDDRDAFLFNEGLVFDYDDRLTNDDTWDNVSYLARVNWAMNDDINFYATYSTGYNSGGFNSRASTLTAWEVPIEEEEIASYEIGMKSEWFDSRVRANIAIFYNEYDDIQIAQFEAGSGGASSRIVNAGEATYQGFELDLIAILAEGLTAELTYGYLDAEFDEYLARDPQTNEEVDISNVTEVARAPENTANLGLQYDFKPFSFGALSARVDVQYQDEMVFHPFNNQFDAADDRALVNARISLNDVQLGQDGSLRVSLWGKNLTDEEYREWGIDFGSLGYAGATYGRPLTYGLDVVYNFR